MLPKPNLLKIPNATYAKFDGLNGCSSGYLNPNGSTCNGFECSPYLNENCVDATHCGWGLSVGAGGVIVAGVAISVAIT